MVQTYDGAVTNELQTEGWHCFKRNILNKD